METQLQANAAHNLLHRTLGTGWVVIEKVSKAENSTGAFFSVCYKVEREGQICFLKAFDFTKFFQAFPGKSVLDVMSDMISAFKFERDLSNMCKKGNVTRVAFVVESGEELLPEHPISVVPYLIFDLADGDVRARIDFSHELDIAWRLKSLRDITSGLRQLHRINVSHQDLKPSNVLLFGDASKIGDLGRSLSKDLRGPHSNDAFTGDWNYAPPEIMYDYHSEDWRIRSVATDCYLLGSMLVFFFCGVSMSALLMKHVPQAFRWDHWRGSREDVMPYLIEAFTHAITEFKDCVRQPELRDELVEVVSQLCHPVPEKRGHPRTIASITDNYDLERFISRFDKLYRRFEYHHLN